MDTSALSFIFDVNQTQFDRSLGVVPIAKPPYYCSLLHTLLSGVFCAKQSTTGQMRGGGGGRSTCRVHCLPGELGGKKDDVAVHWLSTAIRSGQTETHKAQTNKQNTVYCNLCEQ